MCQTLYIVFELFFQCNALKQNHNEKLFTCYGDEIIVLKRVC